VGFRRYFDASPNVRPYIEGTGRARFITEIDVVLAAPSSNLSRARDGLLRPHGAVCSGKRRSPVAGPRNGSGCTGQIG